MLRISNLDVSIQSIDILRGVDMSLEKGQMAGLVGRNGAGKTTFIKSIMGLLKPSAGTLEFDGRDLKTVPVHERNQLGVGYMPEDRRLIPNLTVEENVLLPMWASRAPDSAERLQYVDRIIPELVGFAQRRGSQLAGGSQKLVALGRALMTGRQLLLLDEPFEGVAPALAQRLAEVISGLKSEGMAVIFSESDLQYSQSLVQKIFVMDRGTLTETSATAAA